jgi:putative aldouronate transport system substrate-binding protein
MGMYDELVTRNRDGGFNYVPMADLVKQEGDIIHTGTAAYQEGDITAGNVQVITTQTENLDLILELYNFSFSEEGSRIASYGVEGETFEYVNGKPQLTDLVLNNPDISIRHSTGVYLTTIASVIDQGRTASTVTDGQIEAYNIWLSNTDDAYTLDARVLALTTEEADTINRVAGDILTRLEEANIQFITGALNTTTDYDAFVSEMESMGIQDMIDAYQAAYDRYLDR